ncbi:hypothetical protein AVEN_194640-1 [Araneus ventricosus]|uniref:Uncharacterized protein n=1 Tax=Araneus ventricosus TaxID=182803 RepID=A0A4Y2A6V3_ARAVE|nr:hypothetical protein AVEN_194640-1 [Araneus ventricosus]
MPKSEPHTTGFGWRAPSQLKNLKRDGVVHGDCCRKTCYEKSSVIPLLFVNLQPPNHTSINTCLRFVADECKKWQQRHVVTYDQSLFIKAMDIVSQADETDVLSKVIS